MPEHVTAMSGDARDARRGATRPRGGLLVGPLAAMVALPLSVALVADSTPAAAAITRQPANWVAAAAPASAVTLAPPCAVADPESPVYYRIELVTTKRVPGTSFSGGFGDVTFRGGSPFGIALAPDGSYHYDVRITLEGLPEPRSGVYAVWVTTTQLDQVQAVGTIEAGQRQISSPVEWNQFLVVVSLEPSAEQVGARWSGPIVMRGISRSGLMHTMAGHGPFQQENCAAYGYD